MYLLRALFISLAVHFLLLIFIDLGAPYFAPKAPTPTASVTEIEIVPSKPTQVTVKKERQIVRQAEPPKSELKEDDTDLARFLSADRQRVKKEVQAANSGMTQNRTKSSALDSAKSVNRPEQKSHLQSPKDFEPGGVDIAKNLREYARTVEAPSTVGEELPQDVSVGNFTSLNTDKYTYYSFYARIEDMIRFRWESRVRQSVDAFDRNYVMNVIGQKNWLTSVDIWLNRDGRFHSAHILKESGITQFDQAATMAFKDAGMFSNPPAEMVEDDGYIHLRYNFSVRFRPSAIVYQNQ